VFFYTTRSFLETGDDLARPIGNAPFIVDTQDGSIITTTTAEPIEQFLERYARERRAARRLAWPVSALPDLGRWGPLGAWRRPDRSKTGSSGGLKDHRERPHTTHRC